MEPGPAWFQACTCGRTFTLPQAYSCHKNTCPTSKKQLSDDIRRAKDALQAQKWQKLDLQTAIVSTELETDQVQVSIPTQTQPVRHSFSHDFNFHTVVTQT